MTNPVNPPPILAIPDVIFKDKDWLAYERQRDIILFQLWQKLGGNDDPISNLVNFSTSGFSSQVQFLQQQLNGLPEFTIDTTGFTFDSTEITFDKVIA
jgi:hypothetical protein